VIGAKTMEKAESKGGRNQEHQTILSEPNDSKKGQEPYGPCPVVFQPDVTLAYRSRRVI
jgi:hypothetical protein